MLATLDVANAAVNQVYASDWGRIVATLIRQTGDFDAAEEAAQEAFTAAVDQWRRDGIPDSPAAWIIQTARHKAIDRIRTLLAEMEASGAEPPGSDEELINEINALATDAPSVEVPAPSAAPVAMPSFSDEGFPVAAELLVEVAEVLNSQPAAVQPVPAAPVAAPPSPVAAPVAPSPGMAPGPAPRGFARTARRTRTAAARRRRSRQNLPPSAKW